MNMVCSMLGGENILDRKPETDGKRPFGRPRLGRTVLKWT